MKCQISKIDGNQKQECYMIKIARSVLLVWQVREKDLKCSRVDLERRWNCEEKSAKIGAREITEITDFRLLLFSND